MNLAERRGQYRVPIASLIAVVLAGIAASLGVRAVLAVLAALALLVLIATPDLALPVLIVVSALNRFQLHIGSANVRADLLVVVLLAVIVANRIAVRTLPLSALRSPLALPFIAYAGANIFSTWLFAVDRSRGLRLDLEIVAAGMAYILAAALLRRRRDLDRAVAALWVATVLEAIVGLAFAAAYVAHLTGYGIANVATGVPAVYGTTWEPNVFGSLLLGNFFVLLADYTAHARRGWYTLGLVLVVLGMGASLTRTVWIALVLGLVVFYARSTVGHRVNRTTMLIAGGVCVLALLALVLGTLTPLGSRLLDIVNLHSSSASGRLLWFREAIHEWSAHPLFGLGTGSWNFGAEPGQPHPWLPNLFLLTLHDTGLIGMAALLWLIVRFYRVSLSVSPTEAPLAVLSFGCAVGFSCLLIAFQTTTGFWFTYSWIIMAIAISAGRLQRAGG